mmetsp:Transcript_21355/g.46355  ORF Transcript_21355/g.46355 Transcript_21355/m.46355 type:complete len:271 (+) Transcript_21355:454-1266(+)
MDSGSIPDRTTLRTRNIRWKACMSEGLLSTSAAARSPTVAEVAIKTAIDRPDANVAMQSKESSRRLKDTLATGAPSSPCRANFEEAAATTCSFDVGSSVKYWLTRLFLLRAAKTKARSPKKSLKAQVAAAKAVLPTAASTTSGSFLSSSEACRRASPLRLTAASTISRSARSSGATRAKATPFCLTALSTMERSQRNSSEAHCSALPCRATAAKTMSRSPRASSEAWRKAKPFLQRAARTTSLSFLSSSEAYCSASPSASTAARTMARSA